MYNTLDECDPEEMVAELTKMQEFIRDFKKLGSLAVIPPEWRLSLEDLKNCENARILNESINQFYHMVNPGLEEHIIGLAKLLKLNPPTVSRFFDAMANVVREIDSCGVA